MNRMIAITRINRMLQCVIVASEVCRHIVCLQKSVQPLPETLCRSMRRNRMDRVVTGHEQIVSSAGIQVLLDPFPLFFSSRNVCWSLRIMRLVQSMSKKPPFSMSAVFPHRMIVSIIRMSTVAFFMLKDSL